MNKDQQTVDRDDLVKTEVAIAQWLADDADPAEISRAEESLLRAVEDRRRFEQWRRNVPLFLVLGGFIRTPGRIELRGKLRVEESHHGVFLVGSDRTLRRWPGPGHPGRGEMLGADDMPVWTGGFVGENSDGPPAQEQ